MVFSRIFGGGGSGRAPDPDEPDQQDESDEESEVPPEAITDVPWRERAAAVLPSGTSTGSKRFETMWGSADAHAPSHYIRASGCTLVTSDGDELIDCTAALGAVTLGYADERVTQSVVMAAAHGNIAGLPHILEIEVAERFCEAVPCAERVQFVKTGADAMTAAVRIARTATNRTHVIGSGYFGWHDWSSTEAGVPESTRREMTKVPFDDCGALRAAVDAAGSNLAAIALEPVQERLPSPEWIAMARELTTKVGAALIFDEVKTGFRLATGGYQEFSGVTPDLAGFSKGMANGYPIGAVCGQAALMDVLRRTWISSTLACDTTALYAANAVMRVYAESDVCQQLAAHGGAIKQGVAAALRAAKFDGVHVDGLDTMWFLRFDTPELEARFLAAAAANGLLFKRGPYNFSTLAHTEDVAHEIESRTSTALVSLQRPHD